MLSAVLYVVGGIFLGIVYEKIFGNNLENNIASKIINDGKKVTILIGSEGVLFAYVDNKIKQFPIKATVVEDESV